jgi:hypothetical protein
MSFSSVFYLASNSLTAAQNTSGKFSVLFNEPFDLTGKKIALTSATFTKGQANVLDEKITVDFNPIDEKVKGGPVEKNLSIPASTVMGSEPMLTWEAFFNNFPSTIYSGQRPFINVKTKYFSNTRQAKITVRNRSDFPCEISYLNERSPGTAWRVINVPTQKTERVSSPIEAYKVTLTLAPMRQLVVKIDVARIGRYDFNELNSDAGRSRFEDLFQFNIKAIKTLKPLTPTSLVIKPGPGHFDSIDALLSKINKKLASVGSFKYVAGKVHLRLKPTEVKTVKQIKLGGFQHHFGFDSAVLKLKKKKTNFVAQRPTDMTRGTHNFFIYTSLVKNVHINEQRVPLLAVLDATAGEYGQQVQHHVQAPVYVECEEGRSQKIEVSIADDSGNSTGLLQGNTMLTLAIKDA